MKARKRASLAGSSRLSGCHCTPTQKPPPARSTASTTPSSAARRHAQLGPGVRHRLVMAAVDPALAGAERRRDARARLEHDAVAAVAVAELMRAGARQVGGDVVVERPAELERQELHAVADAEQRQAARERRRDQRPVEAELRLGHGFEAHLGRVRPRRQQVVAAGHEQRVDPRHEPAPARPASAGRRQPRRPARSRARRRRRRSGRSGRASSAPARRRRGGCRPWESRARA